MKTTVFAIIITIGVMFSLVAFAQNNDNTDTYDTIHFDKRAAWISVSGVSDVREGNLFTLGLYFHDIPNAKLFCKNVELNFDFGKDLIGFGIGFNQRFAMSKKGNVLWMFLKGLNGCYKNNFFLAQDTLYSKIPKGDSSVVKMIVTMQLGLEVEFGLKRKIKGEKTQFARLGIFATINPGLSLFPHETLSWTKNCSQYLSGKIGVRLLFAGKKYKLAEKKSNPNPYD